MHQAHPHPHWVTLDRYCELSGDTAEAVKTRRKRGIWLDGDQACNIDNRIWVNLVKVDEWRNSKASAKV